MKPLAIDLFCGLGGWTEGLLAAGYRVVGFDIERHVYALPEESPEADGHKHTKPVEKRGWTQGCAITLGMEGESQRPRTRLAKYPAQLVLQDVLTIHGSQFKDAALIVCSPPCQNYSYLAMPWSRSTDPNNSRKAKELRRKWETEGPDNRLFDACFQIQREAIEATRKQCPACAGSGRITWYVGDVRNCERCDGDGTVTRYIPLIVENVRGAVPWVGPERAKFGSFYLWGDVAQVGNRVLAGADLRDMRFGAGVSPVDPAEKVPGFRFDGSGRSFQTASVKVATLGEGRRTDVGKGARFTSRDCGVEAQGTKIGGDWFSDPNSTCRKHGSRSNARKAASAMIAKIPLALSRYIGEAVMRLHQPEMLSPAAILPPFEIDFNEVQS